MEKRTITRNVVLLGLVSLLNDMSSEMIAPIIPGYLIDVLRLKEITSGIIVGLIESLSSILKVLFGYLSDKFQNRKLFVGTGYFLSTFSKAMLGFTKSWFDFLFFKILDRVGKGIRTAPRDALIAESVTGHSSGKAFGFHRMMDTFGAVLGPLVALAILTFLKTGGASSYRTIFFLSAVPGIIAVVIIIFFVKDTGAKVKKKIKGLIPVDKGQIKYFLLVVAIGALGRYSYAFVLWKARSLGYSLLDNLLFYALFNVVYAIFSYPAGVLSDIFGKKRLIMAGFAVGALASLTFYMAKGLAVLLFAFILYGIYVAIDDTVPVSFMADIAGEREKGTVIGTYHTVFGIFVFPASAVAGFLWQTYGIDVAFIFSSVMSFVAFLMMLGFKTTSCS
ncbi:MFS transporter [Desulfurobacterium sp.]